MKHHLRLYVSGPCAATTRAVKNLHQICDESLLAPERYKVEIVDLQERPDLARDETILVTPMLVRRMPEPVLKIIGDLSDHAEVLQTLSLGKAVGLTIVPNSV